MIYLAVQCHNFELRFRWQLASILQQEKGPEIMLDVAVVNKTRLHPDLHALGRYHVTDREVFAKRGYTRNEQTARGIAAGADWLFYADCDNVYPTDFFRCLQVYLDTHEGKTCEHCIASPHKVHTEITATDIEVRAKPGDPLPQNAYRRALALPRVVKSNKRVAAGCMQVVRTDIVRDKLGGIYVPWGTSQDKHLFNKRQTARSDKQFRWRLGGRSEIIWLPTQVHLGHLQDKMVGHHIEDQR